MDQFNFNNFPDSNFNEVNLSWMLETMSTFKEDLESGAFKGDPGDPGPAGPAGPQGVQGPAGPQGDPADPSLVASAVDSYLEENITQETGYVLDRTLTMANAAAPADLVGDLKSALEQAIDDFAVPTQEAVDNWLTAHPEATTTVQDGSLTEAKFADSLKLKTIKDYVTPEMFGAKGDGVTDDTFAVQAAFNSGKNIFCVGSYRITSAVRIGSGYATEIGYFKKRVVSGRGQSLYKYNSGDEIELNVADATFVFDGGYFNISYVAETMFRDVVFMGKPENDMTDVCFYKAEDTSCSHLLVYNCAFANFDYAIHFDGGETWAGENEFRFNFFANCNYAFYGTPIVDSYVCGNIFHMSCLYSWWDIGAGTIFSENHDYSRKGSRARGGVLRGNYFDGLNKLQIGYTSVIGHMIIDGNLFTYNPGVLDTEQAAIIVNTGLIESVICNNQITGTKNISGLYPSLILMKNSESSIQHNMINNNSFDKAQCAVIATVDLGVAYYANECNTPVYTTVSTPLGANNTKYKVQDLGNETRFTFIYTGNAVGTILNIGYGSGGWQNFQRLTKFVVYNKTTGEIVGTKFDDSTTAPVISAADIPNVDYATDGIIVVGEYTIIKGNAPTNLQRAYYTKKVTL